MILLFKQEKWKQLSPELHNGKDGAGAFSCWRNPRAFLAVLNAMGTRKSSLDTRNEQTKMNQIMPLICDHRGRCPLLSALGKSRSYRSSSWEDVERVWERQGAVMDE